MARAGKYDHVTPNLKKWDGIEPERRDIVEAVKVEILTSENSTEYPPELVQVNLDEAEDSIKNVIDLLKTTTHGRRHASEFVRAYVACRGVKTKLQELLANVQLLLDAYEVLMIEHLQIEGTKSMRLDSGASVSVSDQPSAQIQDKEQFRLWCVEQGLERLMHLHPSTAQSLMKERLLAGEPEPPGVEMYAVTEVRLSR